MKQSLVFIHPTLFKRSPVRVGPDLWMFIVGLGAAITRGVDVWSGMDFGWPLYAGVAVIAHVRHWRHVWTLPILGSLALSFMSFGMSACISSGVINRLVAQSLRDAGWKIRNTDGELGEYSSRFLAVDRLGFHDSDLMSAAQAYVMQDVRFAKVDEEPGPTWQDTLPQTRNKPSAVPVLRDVYREAPTAAAQPAREAKAFVG